VSRPKPLSGFPEYTPEARIIEQFVLDRCVRPSSCTALDRSRRGLSSRWIAWPSKVRSTKRSTPCSGCMVTMAKLILVCTLI